MITKDYIISAPEGIHARPAANLVKLVKQYKSVIRLKKGEKIITLNSVLNILTMAAKGGETISVMIEGEDEDVASVAIDHFFSEQLKEF